MRGWCLSLLGLCAMLGCGGSTGPRAVPVWGKLHKGGEVLKVTPPTGMIHVQFFPVIGGADPKQVVDSEYAQMKPDGTFTVEGKDRTGLLPGKYKIAIRVWEPFPREDLLKGAFDENNTKIIREIDGKTPLDLDVSKPEG